MNPMSPPTGRPRKLTAEQIKRIVAEAAKGTKYDALALEYGCARSTIGNMARQHGIKQPKGPKRRIADK